MGLIEGTGSSSVAGAGIEFKTLRTYVLPRDDGSFRLLSPCPLRVEQSPLGCEGNKDCGECQASFRDVVNIGNFYISLLFGRNHGEIYFKSHAVQDVGFLVPLRNVTLTSERTCKITSGDLSPIREFSLFESAFHFSNDIKPLGVYFARNGNISFTTRSLPIRQS